MEEPDETHISLGLNLGTLKTWPVMPRASNGRATPPLSREPRTEVVNALRGSLCRSATVSRYRKTL